MTYPQKESLETGGGGGAGLYGAGTGVLGLAGGGMAGICVEGMPPTQNKK